MLRTVLGIALVTTMVVLSPERDKSSGAPPITASYDGGQFTDAVNRLTPDGFGGKVGAVTAEAVAGQAIATVTRHAAIDPIRRITTAPPPIPFDMPPLRPGRD
jgi:hypothetical protein